jgi:hypothetical protein
MKFERLAQIATVVTVAFCMGAAPAVAKATGGSKAKVPKVAVKTTPKGGAVTHGPASTAHGPKNTSHPAKPAKPAKPTSPTTHGNSSKGTGTGSTATTTTASPTRTQQLLAQNTKLRDKLLTRLPAGTNIDDAAAGFRNLGQFVAAVNVSNNLGLSFDDLKARMTGANPVSLGMAIQQVKGLDVATATTTAQTALTQADREIQSTTTVKSKGKTKTHS